MKVDDHYQLRLVNEFAEVLSYVKNLRDGNVVTIPEYENVYSNVSSVIEKILAILNDIKLYSYNNESAVFAVCAWVDEVFLNLPGEENMIFRGKWSRRLLQKEYFNTSNAGNEFFQRLNDLENGASLAREVFYACLALGFRGRYYHYDDQALIEQLIHANQYQIKINTVDFRSQVEAADHSRLRRRYNWRSILRFLEMLTEALPGKIFWLILFLYCVAIMLMISIGGTGSGN